jgi:hypothetical protein
MGPGQVFDGEFDAFGLLVDYQTALSGMGVPLAIPSRGSP